MGLIKLVSNIKDAIYDVWDSGNQSIRTSGSLTITSGKLSPVTLLNAVNVTDTVEHNSTSQDVTDYQEKTVYVGIAVTGTPTSLDVWIDISPDGVNWYQLGTPKSYTAATDDVLAFTTHAEFMRVSYQGTGTDASNYFTISATVSAKS